MTNLGWTNPLQWNETHKKHLIDRFIWSSNLVLTLRESTVETHDAPALISEQIMNERSLNTKRKEEIIQVLCYWWRKLLSAVAIYHDEEFGVSLQAPEAELSHEPRPQRTACWEMRSLRASVNDTQTDSLPRRTTAAHCRINNLSLTGQL